MADYLPLQLEYGLIAIYNVRQKSSIHNIKAPENFNWGTIYQISPYGIPYYRSVGQSVLWDGKKSICSLAYEHEQYPIYPVGEIVTVET